MKWTSLVKAEIETKANDIFKYKKKILFLKMVTGVCPHKLFLQKYKIRNHHIMREMCCL